MAATVNAVEMAAVMVAPLGAAIAAGEAVIAAGTTGRGVRINRNAPTGRRVTTPAAARVTPLAGAMVAATGVATVVVAVARAEPSSRARNVVPRPRAPNRARHRHPRRRRAPRIALRPAMAHVRRA